MAEMILEPYAVNQQWRLSDPNDTWEDKIREYLETLARRCDETGKCVIGHIKALAIFPNGAYVRGSVISPKYAAQIEGNAPQECRALTLALNLIVYGLERAQLEQITRETAFELAQRWHAEVTIDTILSSPNKYHTQTN